MPLEELATLRRWNDGDGERKHKSMAAMNGIVAGESRLPCGGMPKNSKTIFIEYIGAIFHLRNGRHIEPHTTFIHISTLVGDPPTTEATHKTGKKSMYFEPDSLLSVG